MSKQEIFQAYLNKRFQIAGAVTPEQRMEVIECILQECRESGIVPIDINQVARLNVQDPVVQAVLRGEEVVLSGRRIGPEKPLNKIRSLTDLRDASPKVKIAVLFLIGGLPILLGIILLISSFAAPGTPPEPQSTPTPSNLAQQEPTLVNPDSAFVENSINQNYMDIPVSMEIGQAHMLISSSTFSRNSGISSSPFWKPGRAEWMSGSRIRKVLAVPAEMLPNDSLAVNQAVTLRYKNGHAVLYIISNVLQVTLDQIEVLQGNSPSLLIVLVDKSPVWRTVAIAEQAELIGNQPEQTPTQAIRNAVVVSSVRLRENHSLSAGIIKTFSPNTTLSVISDSPIFQDENYWVFVEDSEGARGWVSIKYIKIE